MSISAKNKPSIREWPLDWDIHITESVDLYFNKEIPLPIRTLRYSRRRASDVGALIVYHEEDLQHLNGPEPASSIVEIMFSCRESFWVVTLTYEVDGKANGGVFRIVDAIFEDSFERILDSSLCSVIDLFRLKPVAHLSKIESGFDAAVTIEMALVEDYWKNGGEGGGGDEPSDDAPTPSDSLTDQPLMC